MMLKTLGLWNQVALQLPSSSRTWDHIIRLVAIYESNVVYVRKNLFFMMVFCDIFSDRGVARIFSRVGQSGIFWIFQETYFLRIYMVKKGKLPSQGDRPTP